VQYETNKKDILAVEQLDGSKLQTTLSYLMVKMFEQDLY